MEVEFKPFIPQNFQKTDDVFCLIFSSEIKSIDNSIISNGLFESKIQTFHKPVIFDIRTASIFQFLMIVSSNKESWISNIYYTEKGFLQGPWICSNVKQSSNNFEISIKSYDENNDKLQMFIESSGDLNFSTPHKTKQENEWVFNDFSDKIKGTISSKNETSILITAKNKNNLGTSISLILNKKSNCDIEETSLFKSISVSKIIGENKKSPSFIRFKNLSNDICILGANHIFENEAIIPKDKIKTAMLYNFSKKDIVLEVEIIYEEENKFLKENIKYNFKNSSQNKKFDTKNCIKCEKQHDCTLLNAFKLAKTYAPWTKFLI